MEVSCMLDKELEATLLDVDQAFDLHLAEEAAHFEELGSATQSLLLGDDESPLPLKSIDEFWRWRKHNGDENNDELALNVYPKDFTALDVVKEISRGRQVLSFCDSVSENIEAGKRLLDGLKSKHATISNNTTLLSTVFRKRVEECLQLERFVEQLEFPFRYFSDIDRISLFFKVKPEFSLDDRLVSNRLNGLTDNYVGVVVSNKMNKNQTNAAVDTITNSEIHARHLFAVMRCLDDCVDYLELHPEFNDFHRCMNKVDELYSIGFQHVANFVVNSVQMTSQLALRAIESMNMKGRVSNRKDGELSYPIDSNRWEECSFFDIEKKTSLFDNFLSLAEQIRPFAQELENRVKKKSASDALLKCQNQYARVRLALIHSTLPGGITVTGTNSLISTLRSACPRILLICRKEHELFNEYFASEATDRVIFGDRFGSEAQTVTTRLSDWSDVVNGSVSTVNEHNEPSTVENIVSPRDAFGSMTSEICGTFYDSVRPLIVVVNDLQSLCELTRMIEGDLLGGYAEELATYGRSLRLVIFQVLRDVQERIAYRTGCFITEKITNFQPTPEDLDYPKALRNPSMAGTSLTGYYPTVCSVLQCLIWIYRCVERRVFEELAQDAILSCIESIRIAARRVSQKSRIDGDLLMVKNLLMLREQISPFTVDIVQLSKGLDFKPTAAALGELLANPAHIFSRTNNSVLKLLVDGAPTVSESEQNCKLSIETSLEKYCQKLIFNSYEFTVSEILRFLRQAEAKVPEHAAAFEDQDFGAPGAVEELITSSLSAVPKRIELLKGKLAEYINDQQTEQILYHPIRANIFSALSKLSSCIEARYSQKDSKTLLLVIISLRQKVSKVG